MRLASFIAFITGFLGIIYLQYLQQFPLLEYLFHLRMGLGFGLLLLSLPFIAEKLAPSLLANIAELETPRQLIMVVLMAVITAMAVVRVTATGFCHSADRFNFLKDDRLIFFFNLCTNEGHDLSLYLGSLAAFLLALPLLIWVSWRSRKVEGMKLFESLSLANLLAVLLMAVYSYISQLHLIGGMPALALSLESLQDKAFTQGYVSHRLLAKSHIEATVFLAFSSLLYLSGYWLFKPRANVKVPSLFFILLLMTNLCLFLAGIAFFLDYYPVPTLLVFGLISLSSYFVWKVDHYYRISPLKDSASDQTGPSDAILSDEILSDEIFEAMKARLALQEGKDKELIILSIAGGGIQAATWSAKLLSEFENYLPGFSQKVGLVSAVSGGSVAALFYLDAFGEDGSLEAAELEALVERSGQNSLDAIAWGIAYPDFWRLFGFPFGWVKEEDRGSALEDSWAKVMKNAKASFKDWARAMRQGQKPIGIFNATLVQDGRRYLLSPLAIREKPEYKSIDFRHLYPHHDIMPYTAVRLSATFPFVTPIARNSLGEPSFHVADGGYFDNFGLFTALNILDDNILPRAKELNLKKILILEIRSFPAASNVPKLSPFTGWLMQAFGPLITLFSIRGSTQSARNDAEREDLIKYWQERCKNTSRADEVVIEHIKLGFPSDFAPCDGLEGAKAFHRYERYMPPLSWKLSQEQIHAINDAWIHTATAEKEKGLKTLQTFLGIEGDFELSRLYDKEHQL
ncbi:MAG: patatin-like phospholipase family protein [Deinococcales bacterium]